MVSDSTDKTLEVIDGQQRLTTLFLTVCALKHLLGDVFDSNDLICKKRTSPDGSTNINYRLNLRYEGAEDFCHIISSAPSYDELKSQLIEARGKLFGSLENLANAYQSIILFLRNQYSNHEELDIESLLRFWGYSRRINDYQWQRIYSYLSDFPKIHTRNEERCRQFVEAIFWMAKSGSQW